MVIEAPPQAKDFDPWRYVLGGRADDAQWSQITGAGRFQLIRRSASDIRFEIGYSMWGTRRFVHVRREGDAWRAWSCRRFAWLVVPFNPAWIPWDWGEARALLAQRIRAAGIDVPASMFPPAALLGRGPAGMILAWSAVVAWVGLNLWLDLR